MTMSLNNVSVDIRRLCITRVCANWVYIIAEVDLHQLSSPSVLEKLSATIDVIIL